MTGRARCAGLVALLGQTADLVDVHCFLEPLTMEIELLPGDAAPAM